MVGLSHQVAELVNLNDIQVAWERLNCARKGATYRGQKHLTPAIRVSLWAIMTTRSR